MKYIHMGVLFAIAWGLNAVAPAWLAHFNGLDGLKLRWQFRSGVQAFF